MVRKWMVEKRKSIELTQSELAKRTGLSQQLIAKVEYGGGLSVKSAKAIAEVLEISWTKFFD